MQNLSPEEMRFEIIFDVSRIIRRPKGEDAPLHASTALSARAKAHDAALAQNWGSLLESVNALPGVGNSFEFHADFPRADDRRAGEGHHGEAEQVPLDILGQRR